MPDFKAPWHGIPRQDVPWYPTVDLETCIGCTLCFATCGLEVYDFDYDSHWAVVADPDDCMVGFSTCGTVCPAGEFGEKRFLVELEELVSDVPFDLVDLVLQVPTGKGAAEHTPSFMSFDLVSTAQQEVTGFIDGVRQLVNENDLVLVAQQGSG